MDMTAIAKYVEEAVKSYNKMTPEMESAIKAIIDFKYPDDSKDESLKETSNNSEQKEQVPTSSDSDGVLFDIKVLNEISDKMIRGSLKKVYMAGKRAKKTTSDVVIDFKNYLNDNNIDNDEVKSILNSLNVVQSDVKKDNLESQANTADDTASKELFDIKELNLIDDKIARATSKKAYMACKRANKNSIDTVQEILKVLKDSGKLNDDDAYELSTKLKAWFNKNVM